MAHSKAQPIGQTDLPLVRLSLVVPFIQELDKRRVDVEKVLSDLNLSRESIFTPALFVPAPVMYELLEMLAQSANDPYLGTTIGETLDLRSWPVFTKASANATTVGDFFLRFTMEADAHATSVQMELKTDGKYATFRVQRVFEPEIVPAQADAFYVGLFSNIVSHAAGIHWNPREVIVVIGDLRAVPKRHHDILIMEGDHRGVSIRFPMQWLLESFEQKLGVERSSQDNEFRSPPRSLIDSIRETLLPHLHLSDLSVAHAAELCGYRERTLRRKLKDNGTTMMKEITRLREEKATSLLVETDSAIADIGRSVGINNPSVFTRSFKKWTGMSPKEYRVTHRNL
jgi:AraC-like DNA-binding protein